MMVVVEHALMLPKKLQQQQQPHTIPLSEVDSMDINTSYCFMVEYMDQKTTTTTTNPTRHPHLRTLTLFPCWFIIGQHSVP